MSGREVVALEMGEERGISVERELGEECVSGCGCGVPVATADGDDDDAVEHLWQVRDIQFGLVSGVLLLAGFLSGLAGVF